MEAKLTLKLDKDVIEKAKKYSPLVEELSGVIKIDNDFDFKKEYTDYLIEIYQISPGGNNGLGRTNRS